jgi:hypothetical protein
MNPEINPLGLNYGMDTTAVVPFARPTAIIVTGRGNRYDAAFQEARRRGALVYAYWNPINIPVGSKNPQDLEQWMRDTVKVPRWRFQGSGPVRSTWPNTELADIRPGSVWRAYFREITEQIIAKNLFDGFFCDETGARPWAADWESWPLAEQKLWSESMVDVARDVHEARVKINPKFEIVHNNVWHLPSSHPAFEVARTGDRYCNGVCLENTTPDPVIFKQTGKRVRQIFHVNYAARTFAGDPFPRRLLSITNHPEMFEQWKSDANVTHITLVSKLAGEDYMRLTAPQVPYHDLGSGPVIDWKQRAEELAAAVEQLHADNEHLKRVNASQSDEISGLRESHSQITSLADQIAALSKR